MEQETQTPTAEVETKENEVTEDEAKKPEEIQEEVVVQKPKAEKKVDFKPLPYFENAKVICGGCGNSFTTGSTKEEIHVEICYNCHPFFTGQEKFVDTEGRVERFKRLESSKVAPKAKKEVEKKDNQPKTLKEMLMSLEKQ